MIKIKTLNTQEWNWALTSSINAQSSFFLGENLEICAKRGVMSGINATSAPVFVECNIMTAPNVSHNVFVQAMLDVVYIHDVVSGNVDVRL